MSAADIERASDYMADKTGGYVAADITALVRECCVQFTQLQRNDRPYDMLVRFLLVALGKVPPSCLRGVAINIPELSLDDVIGCSEAKEALCRILAFVDPVKRPLIGRFGVSSPGGAILYGPPGNSKTRLVNAVASVYKLPVISLSSADVYSAYVGDAEAEIRKAFGIARQASPCVLFFDEIDALVTDRGIGSGGGGGGSGGGSSSSAESRVLATLLNEMDGIGNSLTKSSDQPNIVECGVIVLAATNRIDSIDKALLRKGRFHHVLHIPNPGQEDRLALLEYFTSKYGISEERKSGLRSQMSGAMGMSGAEVENVCRETAMEVLRTTIASTVSSSLPN
jgi:transitional endoplasmic reticulum ATPase